MFSPETCIQKVTLVPIISIAKFMSGITSVKCDMVTDLTLVDGEDGFQTSHRSVESVIQLIDGTENKWP